MSYFVRGEMKAQISYPALGNLLNCLVVQWVIYSTASLCLCRYKWEMTGTMAPQRRAAARSAQEPGPPRVLVAMSFREQDEPALEDYWHAMTGAAERRIGHEPSER